MSPVKLLSGTDIHIGFRLRPSGTYWSQTPWPDGYKAIFSRIRRIREERGIDAFVFAGDLTHDSGRDDIRRAIDALRSVGCPCVLAFGNHDRLDEEALGIWQEELANEPWLIWSGRGMLSTAACDIIPVDNCWLGPDGVFRPWWEHSSGCFPLPGISDEELKRLERMLLQHPETPAIVVIHAPCWLFPPMEFQVKIGEAGMEHLARYASRLGAMLFRYPRARLMLTGHIHRTTSMQLGATHLSTAALLEVPHQVRLITVDDKKIVVTTEALAQDGDPLTIRQETAFLLGESRDQHVTLSVHPP